MLGLIGPIHRLQNHLQSAYVCGAACCVAQEKKDKSSSDASLYIFNSSLTHNKVFHAVVLVKGERRDWQRFEHAKALAVIKANGNLAAAATESLTTFSASS
jgi:hypothetical protein